ncbi:hypothetical protein UFOVP836_32 [uncultured Caudovirales phage]|uniref:Uncharacterized protein n=1 Tax=uncultured Caudovirales phage TaxID=2100421 RepID=A0A6J5P8S8_9CAUD|nr:hypothetical protein UFOVP836_32 [uncultured Caudovirales phage]
MNKCRTYQTLDGATTANPPTQGDASKSEAPRQSVAMMQRGAR